MWLGADLSHFYNTSTLKRLTAPPSVPQRAATSRAKHFMTGDLQRGAGRSQTS